MAFRAAAVAGPGLVVMLADTDVGSVITAAQSGARYGFNLVIPELALIPALYVVQEITVRLGITTGAGHGALIRANFGQAWSMLSALTLFMACLGALITEFSGLAGVGQLIGLPRWLPVAAGVLAIGAVITSGCCQRVLRAGIIFGALELLFLPAAILVHPAGAALMRGLGHPLQSGAGYLDMLAANVGAVIMPWMVFYQQQAVAEKGCRGLGRRQALRCARLDTAVGSVVTQLIMIAILIIAAATLGVTNRGDLGASIAGLASSLTPLLGRRGSDALFGLGITGAATVAALVVSLAGAWGVAEAFGWPHSLNDTPRHAPGFYCLAAGGLTTGAAVALLTPDLTSLSVDVEIFNACLLPVVLGFLLALERKALPATMRMRGPRRAATYLLTGTVILFGIFTASKALFG
jgi:Mn2+/Fe2+ NRAMP family transporter